MPTEKNLPGFVTLSPLLAGLFDFCVFTPLFGLSFVGKHIRQM